MAAVSQCPDPHHLQQLLLGRLPAPTAERLEAHVHQCPRCANLLPTLLQDDTLVDAVRARAKLGLQQHERDLVEGLMIRLKKRPAVSHDTTTGDHTMGAHADDASRQLCSFLAPPQSADELGRLGGYRVLKVLGHGGMGVVFQAEDPHLKRSVAVKAMLPDVARKATARERFLREARAAAALEHDHIVPIYHVGEERGVPYLVMPFLKGASLEDFAHKRKGEPGAPGGLSAGQILKVGREIAKGLSAAHEVGLIHRDIKPGNIWLDSTTGGRVRILDFGLARATSDDANLTSPGLIVGTPSYMAPEQAQGRPVDGRADLFSLGCVLYKLCTGQVPFRGNDAVSTLLLAATEEPTPIEESNRDVPPALCDLVRRLMAKNPQDRPISARSVVEEITAIERSLSNAHIKVATLVNPEVSQWQQFIEGSAMTTVVRNPLKKRARRWPWVAAALAGLAAAVLLAVATFTVKTEDGTFIVETNDPEVTVAINKMGGITITDQKAGKKFHVKAGKQKLPEGDYQIEVTEAASGLTFETRTFTIKRGKDVVVKAGLEKALAKLPPEGVDIAKPKLPDLGKALAELDWAKPLALSRSLGTQNKGVRSLALSPDQQTVAAALEDNTVGLMDRPTNTTRRVLKGAAPIRVVAYSPDGKLLASSGDDQLIHLWNPASGQSLGVLPGHASWIMALAFSPDGKLLVSGSEDGTARSWIVQTKREHLVLRGHTGPVRGVAFSPDGQTLATAGGSWSAAGELILWNPANGQQRHPPIAAPGAPLVVAFSPDGKHVAVATRFPVRTVQLCDAIAGRALTTLPELSAAPIALAYLPDGKTVAVGMIMDKDSLELWDLTSRQRRASLEGHPGGTAAVSVSSDGKTLASGGRLGGVNLYDLPITSRGGLDEATVRRIQQIQKLPAEGQVKEVAKWLQELNPGFDGRVFPELRGGQVWKLTFATDQVTDISPLRALKDLKILGCAGSEGIQGKLTDLTPLQGLALQELFCYRTKVRDLTPLRGMPLQTLEIYDSEVADLSPLKGMPLTRLSCRGTKVADLSPLQGMPLTWLSCGETPIRDFTPLRGLPLATLHHLGLKDVGDLGVIRGLATLKQINDQPAADFWKQYDARASVADQRIATIRKMPADGQVKEVAKWLQELNPGFDGKVTHKIEQGMVRELQFVTDAVTNITPVQALPELRVLGCAGTPSKLGMPSTGRLADLTPLLHLKLTTLYCSSNQIADLSPLRELPLVVLHCGNNPLKTLAPLQGMKLTLLEFPATAVADLAPLRDMPLTRLNCAVTQVTDLTPLSAMQLTWLSCTGTRVANLEPLRGMKLTFLHCPYTPVADLTPLKGMKLVNLHCQNTSVNDLSVLKDMPLQELRCDFRPERDADLLRGIRTLQSINSMSAVEFWKRAEAEAAIAQRAAAIQKLPADEQVKAVAQWLVELNPSFEGRVTHKIEQGVVKELQFLTDAVTNITPVQALTGLRTLDCAGTPAKGRLADLSPLRGLKLTTLYCGGTQVADLSPLQDMKLITLHCTATPVADLSPLRNMKLTSLYCTETNVADLSPLKDMKLTTLQCAITKVSDLSPLKDMQLTTLRVSVTPVTDLSPLKDMKLINLYFSQTKVADLTPLQNMPLKTLHCDGTAVSDLSLLVGMPLEELRCDVKAERGAALLRGIRTLQAINGMPAAEFWKRFDAGEFK